MEIGIKSQVLHDTLVILHFNSKKIKKTSLQTDQNEVIFIIHLSLKVPLPFQYLVIHS